MSHHEYNMDMRVWGLWFTGSGKSSQSLLQTMTSSNSIMLTSTSEHINNQLKMWFCQAKWNSSRDIIKLKEVQRCVYLYWLSPQYLKCFCPHWQKSKKFFSQYVFQFICLFYLYGKRRIISKGRKFWEVTVMEKGIKHNW